MDGLLQLQPDASFASCRSIHTDSAGRTLRYCGNVFGEGKGGHVSAFGVRVQEPAAFKAGTSADLGDGETLQLNEDGSYQYSKNASFDGSRAKRVYVVVSTPPIFTLDNYRTVLLSEGIGQSFVNSLTVAIPATIIPILIAAFAAYALSWMRFSGRSLMIALVVGLIVVPLQMSLIPLLSSITGSATSLACRPRPMPASGWHTQPSACRSPSICCAIISPACRRKSSRALASMAQRFRNFRQDRLAAVLPGARLLCHLPVSLDLERPARRHGVPRHTEG